LILGPPSREWYGAFFALFLLFLPFFAFFVFFPLFYPPPGGGYPPSPPGLGPTPPDTLPWGGPPPSGGVQRGPREFLICAPGSPPYRVLRARFYVWSIRLFGPRLPFFGHFLPFGPPGPPPPPLDPLIWFILVCLHLSGPPNLVHFGLFTSFRTQFLAFSWAGAPLGVFWGLFFPFWGV
jgi:hypothetical protein